MSTLNLNQRDAFRGKIETTLASIQARGELTAEALVAEIMADAEELMVGALQTGIAIGAGPKLAPVIYADLTNHLGETDAELAVRFGLERSTVSRILIRSRRNLGYAPRQPLKRRPHRRTKAK